MSKVVEPSITLYVVVGKFLSTLTASYSVEVIEKMHVVAPNHELKVNLTAVSLPMQGFIIKRFSSHRDVREIQNVDRI